MNAGQSPLERARIGPSCTTTAQVEALRQRIVSLRSEIAQAEAKIPRTVEAIRRRKHTLARLEAQLALVGELRRGRTSDE